MPSYWVRSRFEPADAVAATFRFGLLVRIRLQGKICLNSFLSQLTEAVSIGIAWPYARRS